MADTSVPFLVGNMKITIVRRRLPEDFSFRAGNGIFLHRSAINVRYVTCTYSLLLTGGTIKGILKKKKIPRRLSLGALVSTRSDYRACTHVSGHSCTSEPDMANVAVAKQRSLNCQPAE